VIDYPIMASRLLMICPSRGRPANVARLLWAWKQTAGQAHLLIAVDDDDPELDAYHDVLHTADAGHFAARIEPRRRLGPTLNRLATINVNAYDAIGFLGDDHVPRTVGWDSQILVELTRLGTGFVYGNDLLQGPTLPTAVAMTSNIIRTLGWMVPPGLVHLYIDNAWLDIGRGLGRIAYLPDVVIEHVHPVAGKAEWDDRYAEVNSAEQTNADHAAYVAWVRESMPTDVEKLRRLVEAT
jgi:hypothetical protein